MPILNQFCARWARPVLVAFLLCAGRDAEGKILEDVVRQSYVLSPTARVTIRNTDGRICVYGSDVPRLEIMAVRRAFSQERLEGIKIEVSINEEVVTIDTRYPPVASDSILADRSGTVDYVILVPMFCSLPQVELQNGEVVVDGIYGKEIDVHLERGLLHFSNCFSAARVSLGQGNLDVTYDWWEPGAFSLAAEVKDGDVRVALPAEAAVRIEADAPKGHVENSLQPVPNPGDAHTLQLDMGNDAASQFRFRTEAGNIRFEPTF
ncbi:MAG: DUF4097 family beta strand repeat-containing protein [Chthoniobacterales bacterium]